MSTQYYVQIGRRAFGPFTTEAFQEMISRGKVGKSTLVSLDKRTWKEAVNFFSFSANDVDSKSKENARLVPTETFTEPILNVSTKNKSSREWFVSVDGRESSGPFATRELFDLFHSGQFTLESLVWRQGDSVSQKLGENREIQQEFESFHKAPDPFNVEKRTTDEQLKTEIITSPTVVVSQDQDTTTRRFTEQLASKIQTRFLSTWICIGVMTVMIVVAIILQLSGIQTFSYTKLTTGFFVQLIAVLCLIGAVVFGAAFLHAFWLAIPPKYARANPDEAVAFMFVPGFRLYWVFQALYGGALDADEALKQYVDLENNDKNALFVSPGWALATSVFFDLGGPFNPVSGLFFLLCLGVTTVQMKNVALKLDSLSAARFQTNKR